MYACGKKQVAYSIAFVVREDDLTSGDGHTMQVQIMYYGNTHLKPI